MIKPTCPNCGCAACACGIADQSLGLSRKAVTRIAPNEAQGTAGAPIQDSASTAHAFRHMIEWSAPGLGQDVNGFGPGFQKH